MASVKLSSVIWRRFEEETDGVRWKGKFKTTKAEKDSVIDLYEYKEHIIYDDDENERLQSGSDRYDIKAIVANVNHGAGITRADERLADKNILLQPSFDFIYECPLVRDFCVASECERRAARDFLRISFDHRIPDTAVQRILTEGILIVDPHNNNKICLYRFFAYTPSQSRQRSCTLVNYDSHFWRSNKLQYVKGYHEFKAQLDATDDIEDELERIDERRRVTKNGVKLIWKYFGNFDKIGVVAKYAARVGLLMSPTRCHVSIPDHKWCRESDILGGENNRFEFTDGCGRMSTHLAKLFVKKLNIQYRYNHQSHKVPSVLQFRMMGCKGILVHDPSLDEQGQPWVVLRDSQWKFDWNMETVKYGELSSTGERCRVIGTCTNGESRPFSFGKLNKQYVVLLEALGIDTDTFLEIQKHHFERLRSCLDDRQAAFEILTAQNKMEEADMMTELDTEDDLPNECDNLLSKFRKPVFELPSSKPDINEEKNIANSAFYIPVSKSRNIYGVADISGKLKKGECFVQVTDIHPDTSIAYSHQKCTSYEDLTVIPLKDGIDVLVNKCPTYYAGDFRVLTNRYIPELSHLVDVIVFPVAGDHAPGLDRPHPHEMHESDLDGDEYFVCWDEKLIPKRTMDPHPAPIKAKIEQREITLDDLVMEFSHNDHLVGQINNLFMKWADLNGALSEECQQLAIMFNQSVDQAKHGTGNVEVSDHLRSCRDKEPETARIQSLMVAEIKKQPFKATLEFQQRYGCLNNAYQKIPKRARYFFIDVHGEEDFTSSGLMRNHDGIYVATNQNKMHDFHCMVKYNFWTDRDPDLVEEISLALKRQIAAASRHAKPSTQGAARLKKKLMKSKYSSHLRRVRHPCEIFLVFYHKLKATKEIIALAKTILPKRRSDMRSPALDFVYNSLIDVDWLFVGEMDLHVEAMQIYGQFDISENRHKNPYISYEHGEELPPELGDEIFKTYRKEAKQYTLENDYEPVDGVIPRPDGHLVGIDYVYRQWPKNEKLVLTGNNSRKKKAREEMKVNENNRNNAENKNKKNGNNCKNNNNIGMNPQAKHKSKTNAFNDFSNDEFSPPTLFQSFFKTSKLPPTYSNCY